MHTNDMLTGPRLCACVKIETVFMNDHSICLNRLEQAPLPKCICTCERVTFSDAYANGARRGTHISTEVEVKMMHFQPNFRVENCIPRSFSATPARTEPLNACHNTTQQALSTHQCSIVSTSPLPDLDEKSKKRVISPGRGETRLNSYVCEVLEGRYSIDNNSAPRACCVVSIERVRDP